MTMRSICRRAGSTIGWSARHSALGVALLTGATACTPPPSDADTAIRAALAGWTADFNAGRAERVCDLFATDLRFDFRGVPERGYPEMCEQLHTTLADPTRRFTYGFRVKDVRVSG